MARKDIEAWALEIVNVLKYNADLPDDLKQLAVSTRLTQFADQVEDEVFKKEEDAVAFADYSPYLPLEGSVGKN